MCDASTTSGTASGGWVLSMGDVFGVTSATSPRRTCENNNLEAPSGRCLEISELSVNSPTSCSGFAATPRLYRVPTPVTRQKSSCLSARSTLHRERSTSSSKVSTSGDLRFERKLSKLRNCEPIRLPSARHKSHMGRSSETSVVQPSMRRRQRCLPRCPSRQSIRQGSPWRREPSSNPDVSPLQTGIESRLRMR